ncbi:hypothetical protein [Natronorubrum sp. FCH18a]|uniref:hypothetical protein n=1 Tax=Natronorubrum sp. FCH18a TaxID=3447018 RepID=UPI003F517FD3
MNDGANSSISIAVAIGSRSDRRSLTALRETSSELRPLPAVTPVCLIPIETLSRSSGRVEDGLARSRNGRRVEVTQHGDDAQQGGVRRNDGREDCRRSEADQLDDQRSGLPVPVDEASDGRDADRVPSIGAVNANPRRVVETRTVPERTA